ncbi:MAG: hypothetical protein AB1492_09095 [Bacillota bacterium]
MAGVCLAVVLALWLMGARGKLCLPSTVRLVKAGGLRRLLSADTVSIYVYARWTKSYVRLGLRRLRVPVGQRSVAEHYYGKVLTHAHAHALVSLADGIEVPDLEQVIPYATVRKLVLEGPLEIAAYECDTEALPGPVDT